MTVALHPAEDADADALLSRDPLALLPGMLLDQHSARSHSLPRPASKDRDEQLCCDFPAALTMIPA